MTYNPEELKVAAFIAGKTELYSELISNPNLRMISIDRVDQIRDGLYKLGYKFRIRYRGPHRPQHDTLKQHARAFTVYIQQNS